MATTPDEDTTRQRFMNAAVALAVAVSTDERIKTDPTYPADRRPRSDDLRAESFTAMLAEFRAAEAAFSATWAA